MRCGIVSGGEFERSCGTSGRSEDVLDLSSYWQGWRNAAPTAWPAARSVARPQRVPHRGPAEQRGGPPMRCHVAPRFARLHPRMPAQRRAARWRRSSGRSRSKIANAGRARHRVAGDLSEFGPAEFDCRGVVRHGVILLYSADVSTRRPLAGGVTGAPVTDLLWGRDDQLSARAESRRTRRFRARESAAHRGSVGWHLPHRRRPAIRTPVRSPRRESSGLPPR